MKNTIKLFQTYVFLTQESTLHCFFMISNSYTQLTTAGNERSLYDLIFSSFFGFSLHCYPSCYGTDFIPKEKLLLLMGIK